MEIYSFVIGVPFLAALICIVRSDIISRWVTILASVIALVTAIYVVFLPPIKGEWLYVDGLSKIMLFVISVIYFTTTLFSSTYLNHVNKPLLSRNWYYFFLNVFTLTMLASVMLNNVGLIWVGIEATTITSALLVAIDNEKPSIESSWRYIIIVSTGLVMSLVGIMFIYSATGSLNLEQLMLRPTQGSTLLYIGAALTISGFSTKAGIFPMHTWLPDVHGRSIAPVSAMFSSVLLPTALFGVARILSIAPFDPIRIFTFLLGTSSVVFASIFLVNQRFYKRMFAYSSMENMGMILVGLSLNNEFGILGAVMLLIAHAFAKSSAFYTTGNMLAVFGTRQIKEIKGMHKSLPGSAYNLVFSSLAVTGAPPFGTFLGELFIIYAVYKTVGLGAAILIVLFLLIAFLSVNYKVAYMCFSESDGKTKENIGTMSLTIPYINTILALISVFFADVINALLHAGVIK